MSIARLDLTLGHGVVPVDSAQGEAARRLFDICGYGTLDSANVAAYASRQSISAHLPEQERQYASLDNEEQALGRIFTVARQQLPSMALPEVYAIVSPFDQSVIIDGHRLYIGLNHYLGPDYGPYGYFPDYKRCLKMRQRIPIDITEALVRTSFPYCGEGEYPTLLSRIAWEGAVAEAVGRLTGETPAAVLGYTPQQFTWLEANERNLWDTMVSRGMLFSTDPSLARSLTAQAPYTSAFSVDAPPQAGRYMGLKLVQSYLSEHPKVSISQLLSPEFYNSGALLAQAKYFPAK